MQQPDDHGLVAHLTLRAQKRPHYVMAVMLVTGHYAGYLERGTSNNELSLEAQLAQVENDQAQMRRILTCEDSQSTGARSEHAVNVAWYRRVNGSLGRPE